MNNSSWSFLEHFFLEKVHSALHCRAWTLEFNSVQNASEWHSRSLMVQENPKCRVNLILNVSEFCTKCDHVVILWSPFLLSFTRTFQLHLRGILSEETQQLKQSPPWSWTYVSSLSGKIVSIPNSCLWQEMEEVETGKQPKKNPLTFSILSAVSWNR